MAVKPQRVKRVPVLITCGVIFLICFVRCLQFDLFERLERLVYDMQVRTAVKYHPPAATNLGFVFIDEASIEAVHNGSLGYKYGLYWPRQVYGRLVEELAAQGARAVAFDVIFGELRPDHPTVQMADGTYLESDEFLALQMLRASNCIIAVTTDLTPPAMFLTNALALADISTDKDVDGILRRARPFRTYRKWHAAFRQLEADPDYGVDLRRAVIEPNQIVLPRPPEEPIKVPLDNDGYFDLADFGGDKLPPGTARKARPFTDERAWHMGVVLAALELGLDLSRAEVDSRRGTITLRGRGGILRQIPVDAEGYFYIDWSLPPEHPQLVRQPIQYLLKQDRQRLEGQTNGLQNLWRDKLVVVGSSALANDLTDRGATPLRKDTLLVSKHWNVANSILVGRFVRRAPLSLELALIVVLGMLAAYFTWELRVLVASGLVLLMAVLYVLLSVALYVNTRFWIPLVLPLLGAMFMTHVCVVTWRVLFEQSERRRVRSIFSKMVSPKIVHELLAAETLSLGGARREITVFFADVRGFTELTDATQERVAEFVHSNQLSGAAAEACFDNQARETLETVNLYLGLIADITIRNDGTLDKFIGDCVMAFWGAPASNPRHAVACVRTAIQVQRAIHELNLQRAAENQRRQAENASRAASGLPPQPLLPVLSLGSGINTGMATAGLMGSSKAESLSYTVFGREVNLASRLEGASGRGRIFISQVTFEHLLRDDSALASTCVPLEPLKVKGFRTAVKVYEVPWQPPAPCSELALSTAASPSPISQPPMVEQGSA